MNLHICEVTAKNWRSVAALNVAKTSSNLLKVMRFL